MTTATLTEYITTAAHKAAKMLEQENMHQFKEFFTTIEMSDGTKQIVPKTINIELPFTDPITGAKTTKLQEVALISLAPVNFLELKTVYFSYRTPNNNQKEMAIPFPQQQNALNNLIDEYASQFVGSTNV